MFWPNTIVETDVFLKKERGTQIVHKSVRKISQFGEVIDVNFSLKNGHPGLVFVELKREDQANLALSSLDGKTHFGRTFSVKFAEPSGAYSARLTAQSNKENQRSPLDRVAKRPTLDKKEHPLSILEIYGRFSTFSWAIPYQFLNFLPNFQHFHGLSPIIF